MAKYEYAGMAELADALDLGSSGRPCRFKSCYPQHDKGPRNYHRISFWGFFCSIGKCVLSNKKRSAKDRTAAVFFVIESICDDEYNNLIERNRCKLMIFWMVLGGLCLVYFIIICTYAGITSAFSWFWGISGVLGIVLGIFLNKLPGWLQKGIWGIFFAGVAVLLVLEGQILYYGSKRPQPGADYLIVLGCQIRGTEITRSLKYRLEAAVEYGKENPETVIVVSGGQGSGEEVSEAEAMRGYLLEKGISEERIWMEDASTNTYENMKFSRERILKERKKNGQEQEDFRTVVVSNRFHVFRALKIGRKQGFLTLEGLGAKTDPVLFVSYYIREALAVFKDGLLGNL